MADYREHFEHLQSTSQHARTDLREQLVNDGAIGPITQVSVPMENITRVNGILLDVDLGLFRTTIAGKNWKFNTTSFYEQIIKPMLARHSVLARAQVRLSGTGLHVILRLDPPIIFSNEAERQKWAAIIPAIQRVLPSDPDAPGMTGTTRPIGSVNGKNGVKVVLLANGAPVTPDQVEDLFKEICAAPVQVVTRILFGTERISPCPVCGEADTVLSAGDRVAKCYGGRGGCGQVKLAKLYDVFLKPRPKLQDRKKHAKKR